MTDFIIEKWAVIALAVVFTAYLAYIWRKYGVQESISYSYYTLHKVTKWMFSLWCTTLGALIFFIDPPLLLVSGASMWALAAAPDYKRKVFDLKHTVSATITYAYAFLYLIVKAIWTQQYEVLLVVFIALFAVWLLKNMPHVRKREYVLEGYTFEHEYLEFKAVKNFTWWVEVIGFYLLSVGLLLIKF